MDKHSIKDRLMENKAVLKNNYHVSSIGLFGSYVTDEQSPGSDMDFLVEFEKGCKDSFNYMRLKFYLEDLFGTSVDLVMKDAVKERLKERIFGEVEYV